MADDTCSDCGRAHHLHVRQDGIYGCPARTSISGSLCERCHEPMRLHTRLDGVSIVCPGRYAPTMQDTWAYANASMRPRSESPDPLLLAPDKQLSQRYYSALRRSIPARHEGAVIPLRRSSRLENRRRSRAEPYAHTQTRRSSLRMADVPIRQSRSRRVSMQDNMLSHSCSYENESVYPMQHHLPHRKSLQPYVLDRMVPAEDMEPIEGFRPFIEIDPGQLPEPVTVREPMRDLAPKPPFEFVWNPNVVVSAVGGMRVRVGQFERRGHPAGATAPFATSSAADENETGSSMSGTEDYFTVQDWSSSSTPEHCSPNHVMASVGTCPHTTYLPSHPGPSQTGFTRGSVPLQQRTLAGSPGNTYSSTMGNELPQFDALARHYAEVQDQERRLPPLRIQSPSGHAAIGPTPSTSALASRPSHPHESPDTPCPQQVPRANAPFQYPFTPTPTPTPTVPRPSEIEQSHAVVQPRPPRRSTMPGTLPDATITDTDTDVPDRAQTEPAVDEDEDWAGREPWEYIHRVLTTSTHQLVIFLKMPTADIPTAALGALGAELNLQTMVIDNEHWLLIGPRGRDVDLFKSGVMFQNRARSRDKFVFRLGNLNWGANVNQIEDEVCKAVMERSSRGRGMPATLPAQFMAGAMGGFVVWYALSLM